MIPDGFLPYVPLSWRYVAKYERDKDGKVVIDPRTRQARFLGLSKRMRAWPIGWLDCDDDGLVWALA